MKNNWLTLKSLFLCVSALSASGLILSGCTENANLNVGEWSLEYDAHANGIDISKGSKLIYDNVYAAYKLADSVVSTRDYAKHHVSTKKINDHFGEGYHYEVTYTGNNLPVLVQSFYVYPTKDYVLTDFTLESTSEMASNYMAPVNVDRMPEVLNQGENNRALFIPFDNDCWIRYQSHPLTFTELTSYEVTAIFNNDDREAMVIGSVEHDSWKTGITIGKGNIYNVG